MPFELPIKNDHMIDLLTNLGKEKKLLIALTVIIVLFFVHASLNAADEVPGSTELKSDFASTDRSEFEVIICFGDSLTYGIGASRSMDFPSQLARMIQKPVINTGLPGDTTASALQRLERDVLSKDPDIVLITLGGNDFLNGVSKEVTFSNLKKIVESIQARGANVIIGGLKFPSRDQELSDGYEELVHQTGSMLIPNIFANIIGNPELMSDAIHPNNAGYTIIAKRFYEAMNQAK